MASYEMKGAISCGSVSGSMLKAIELVRAGRYATAQAALTAAAECSDTLLPRELQYQCLLLEAWLDIALAGRETGLATLRRALEYGRESGLSLCVLCQAPDLLATLCAEALEAGVEVRYVERLVRDSQLSPPSPALLRWPYPVRVHTLGRPSLVVHGEPVVFAGKAQRRPLMLLHYLVASGGREVAVPRLIAAIWAEAGAGAARSAFDMALTRLRRLIPIPGALLLRGGRLTLGDQVCWIDCRVLERLLGDADRESDPGCSLALLGRAMDLYQGDFLQGEEAPWAVLARERLRARVMRSVGRIGQSLESAGLWAEASLLYERARERFPLEEELCRRLLRSHIHQGEHAQANQAYGRCRELFAKVLGVLPSASTVALISQLQPKSPD